MKIKISKKKGKELELQTQEKREEITWNNLVTSLKK